MKLNRTIKTLIMSLLATSHLVAQNGFTGSDGRIQIEDLAGNGTVILVADNSGFIKKFPSLPKFTAKSNLNVPDVDVNATSWTPVGPSFAVTKLYDETTLYGDFRTNIYITGPAPSGINFIQLRIELQGITPNPYASGITDNRLDWTFISGESIFRNIQAGAYTAQLYARTSASDATVFLHNNGSIIMTEKF